MLSSHQRAQNRERFVPVRGENDDNGNYEYYWFISSPMRSGLTRDQSRSSGIWYAIYCIPGRISNVQVNEKKEKIERHALELSAIPAILTLLASHDPLSALDVEIDAPGPVAALHIADGLLGMALLNEMPHERLVPDRTPLRPRERLQALEISGSGQCMQFQVPESERFFFFCQSANGVRACGKPFVGHFEVQLELVGAFGHAVEETLVDRLVDTEPEEFYLVCGFLLECLLECQ